MNLSFPGVRPKISFLRPVSRENFANALGQTCIHDLRLRRKEKTWRTWNRSRKKADKEARLHYFIVDTGLASFTQLVGVAGPFTPELDHRPIILNVDINKVERGPGYWKFKNTIRDGGSTAIDRIVF